MNKSKNLFTNVAVANIYADDSFSSAVVSQSVLWEKLYLLEEKGSFRRVVCEDGYRGWIHRSQACYPAIPIKDEGLMLTRSFAYFYQQPDSLSPVVRSAVAGSRILIAEDKGSWYKCLFPDGLNGWIEKEMFSPLSNLSREAVIRFAERFLGTPYIWGGKTPLGFDCSGFTQFIHKIFGITIRRDAYMQFEDAKSVSKDPFNAGGGDLCFFSENGEKITHVGLCIGGGKVLHARGMVKINSLNKADTDFDEELFSTFVEVKSFL